MRLPLLAAVLLAPLALSACDRGEREPTARPAEEAPAPAPPPPPAEAPAPPPANTTAPAPHKTAREMRDGPGEQAAPEYAGSRGAATSLSGDDDASPSTTNTTSDEPRTPAPREGPRDPPLH